MLQLGSITFDVVREDRKPPQLVISGMIGVSVPVTPGDLRRLASFCLAQADRLDLEAADTHVA